MNVEQYKKRFFNLMESTIGDVKPLINEQTKLKLKDGHYFADGSGDKYRIKDFSGNDTGYRVTSNYGIRGLVENDPMIIFNGIPTSTTWGEGGEIGYEDLKWNGSVEPLSPTITTNSILNNSIPDIVIKSSAPEAFFKEGKGRFVLENKLYLVDLSNVQPDLSYRTKLFSEYGSVLLTGLQSKRGMEKYPNSYNYLKDKIDTTKQYLQIYETLYYVGKDGKLQTYELN